MTDTNRIPHPLTLADLDLRHVHFAGIGGAGQSALAAALLDMGRTVSGSDWKLSAATRALSARGATIAEGHSAANIPPDATLVVTTAAAKDDNPELVEAARRTLKIVKRAQLLGALCNAHKTCIAVAGTHGKTTTTSMIAFLLERAGLAPSYFIGGVSRNLGASGHIGASYTGAGTGIVVVEADEYDRSFLQLTPDIAVITNIEMDHPDYYKDIDEVREAFIAFIKRIRPKQSRDQSNGQTLLCKDSYEVNELQKFLWTTGMRSQYNFGINLYSSREDDTADYIAYDIEPNDLGGHNFGIGGQGWNEQCRLALPGMHNISNAIAAIATIDLIGSNVILPMPSDIRKKGVAALPDFVGAERRFEVKGEAGGVTVVDDYAHHPTEVRATLAGARARYGGRRIVALFQPHTYSRTRALLPDFAAAFDDADLLGIMPIFAARETNTDGISSEDLIRAIEAHKIGVRRPLPQEADAPPAPYFPPRPHIISEIALAAPDAAAIIAQILEPGDVFITLGAGDVWQVGMAVLARLQEREPPQTI